VTITQSQFKEVNFGNFEISYLERVAMVTMTLKSKQRIYRRKIISKIEGSENWRRWRGILVLEPPWYGSTRTTGVCWRESF
jgi:hypothetical protein